MTPSIRAARSDESGLLSDLALRSKSHWGYSQEFLEACREELTISEGYITSSPVFVLEEGESVAGFYGLRAKGSELELLYLFIEPSLMNRGYGKRLWTHAVEVAGLLGFQKILIESDPYAEAFYRAMGARLIGSVESSLQAGRILPLLEFPLDFARSA
ncbi:MAG TPA: GNAT family N-acetyltransferase [Pyrinomonadaceae bacterium]|nr:GNAT family N-acetyltransferase [Pyrinomonadaceae bacterium]